MMMTRPSLFFLLIASVASIPFQLNVEHRGKECLYEFMDKEERATIDAFILSGSSLAAVLQINGPVAEHSVKSGKLLLEAIQHFDHGRGHHEGTIDIEEDLDFEHYNINEEEESEDEEEIPEHETQEQRKERKARERKKMLEKRKKLEDIKYKQHKHVRTEADPHRKTITAPEGGWYRFCIYASDSDVVAEIDLRKESDAGGVDEDGHVYSLVEKELAEEEKLLEEDSAAKEGLKDVDFQGTRDKLRVLRRLLADIQTRQQQERHRLIVHSATNEHSHSRMVLGSLMETLLFMAVTGFQVFTIRRWFKGAPVLGR